MRCPQPSREALWKAEAGPQGTALLCGAQPAMARAPAQLLNRVAVEKPLVAVAGAARLARGRHGGGGALRAAQGCYYPGVITQPKHSPAPPAALRQAPAQVWGSTTNLPRCCELPPANHAGHPGPVPLPCRSLALRLSFPPGQSEPEGLCWRTKHWSFLLLQSPSSASHTLAPHSHSTPKAR